MSPISFGYNLLGTFLPYDSFHFIFHMLKSVKYLGG